MQCTTDVPRSCTLGADFQVISVRFFTPRVLLFCSRNQDPAVYIRDGKTRLTDVTMRMVLLATCGFYHSLHLTWRVGCAFQNIKLGWWLGQATNANCSAGKNQSSIMLSSACSFTPLELTYRITLSMSSTGHSLLTQLRTY